ncbi:hypothetical protein DFA_07387 [Cavenderia fasciculata]|uniref:Uncharacterized protein n=1 Tax=Cavenderia fasciculata TaxID=261658 RepID=F4PWA0_CACFS|nr:uncharacterized protein DFA_07387 [Cavenderia fasciculata]EGG20264.1 hypothetical protein DFA_07387 [Cavenderia fasciculata]|eukprot:XP_004367247.1 hypothetical protein DFA_07387 [Cavenderia fasciculata]
MKFIAITIVLAIICQIASAQNYVTFRTDINCAGGCDFENPSNWDNLVVPGPTDDALIDFSKYTLSNSANVFVNAYINVNSITIIGAAPHTNFTFSINNDLITDNFQASGNVVVNVGDNSQIYIYSTLTLDAPLRTGKNVLMVIMTLATSEDSVLSLGQNNHLKVTVTTSVAGSLTSQENVDILLEGYSVFTSDVTIIGTINSTGTLSFVSGSVVTITGDFISNADVSLDSAVMMVNGNFEATQISVQDESKLFISTPTGSTSHFTTTISNITTDDQSTFIVQNQRCSIHKYNISTASFDNLNLFMTNGAATSIINNNPNQYADITMSTIGSLTTSVAKQPFELYLGTSKVTSLNAVSCTLLVSGGEVFQNNVVSLTGNSSIQIEPPVGNVLILKNSTITAKTVFVTSASISIEQNSQLNGDMQLDQSILEFSNGAQLSISGNLLIPSDFNVTVEQLASTTSSAPINVGGQFKFAGEQFNVLNLGSNQINPSATYYILQLNGDLSIDTSACTYWSNNNNNNAHFAVSSVGQYDYLKINF